ncbi:hypothetical protein AB0903_03890 [Streptomyces sp. NPDC048389]|uniref:hypothetical protein n=1 Tax=Streptomyces sp. NPDC048389 TaxID=3154622 RepID=UPI003453C797
MFGVATGAQLGVLTDAWLLVSVVLTAGAAAVLGLAVLPAQRPSQPAPPSAPRRRRLTRPAERAPCAYTS